MYVADIIEEQDEMNACKYEFFLWTRKWKEYQSINNLNWKLCRFVNEERANIPKESGIYTFLIQPGIAAHPACSFLMYIGKTKSLYQRFGQYLSERNRITGRPKLLRLLNKYADHVWFCFALLPETDIGIQEEALISAYVPPCNDQFPAEIRAVRGAF